MAGQVAVASDNKFTASLLSCYGRISQVAAAWAGAKQGNVMLVRAMLISAAALALAACSSVDLNEPVDTQPGVCNADKASHVTGKRISETLEQEARRSSGANIIRVIRPGQMVTKDYRIERLNLQLNDHDTVVRAYCG